MNQIENTLEVNKFARRNRHLRVFSDSGMNKVRVKNALTHMKRSIASLTGVSVIGKSVNAITITKQAIASLLPASPQKRLMFQAVVVSTTALLMSSFSVSGSFSPRALDYSNDYIDTYSLPGDVLVADDSGYLVKVNPQTSDSNRVGLTDYAIHTVESGETLSVIAEKYGVKASTIMWENNMADPNSLRIGQSLLVPPVDGVGYKVNSGDTLDKIASKYKITAEAIIAQNGLEENALYKGQSIFLPGAEPIAPPVVASGYRNSSVYVGSRVTNAPASTDTPAVGKIFIFPTRGKVTQGFNGGHYALDIADRSKPPIWAAASGTVEKVSTGTWGGGYGNHVIINHGNGVKTLYGHMDSVNVFVGQEVSQGEVIGIMGNTGRVYGVTGIHLHWEVIINGVKKNPYGYF